MSASPVAAQPDEPILNPTLGRFMLLPIRHPRLFELYKKHIASFWTVEEVDLSQDMKDWDSLSADEQHFIKTVLAFFATSDGVVMENIVERFATEVQLPEARSFYSFQSAMEGIHAEMYALLLETYIRDPDEKARMLAAIETVPAIRHKAEWALRWIASSRSFAERLLAFVCVEGIFFSGSFCAIYWLKMSGKMPGLTFSNELISRDEGLHCEFACELYGMLREKVAVERAHEIIREAVSIEKEFICEALPCSLIGMNSDLMAQYIEYVADRLLVQLGAPRIYGSTNPFPFMNLISMQGKANFFEKRVGDYQKAGVMASLRSEPAATDGDEKAAEAGGGGSGGDGFADVDF